MKVILINAAFSRYGGIKGHGGTMMPLNLCYLAAYARQRHPDVIFKILDAEIMDMSHEETVKATKMFSPDLIGITVNTCVFDSVIALVEMLKIALFHIPIVIGGPHPSAQLGRSLQESKADYAIIGEGEVTLAEVIARLKEGNNDWSKVDGFAYRDETGAVCVNQQRILIEDLDVLPFPARDLIDSSLYCPPPTKRVNLGPNTLIAASRGCPYNCGFCGAQMVWTRRVRSRSPESVVTEIQECVCRYGIRSFHFTDEIFTADRKRVLEICHLITKRRLDVAWVCSARAQRLNKETLGAMKESGCREISFGIESGNEDILKRIDKALDLKEVRDIIRIAKKLGITTHASYILGYIGETEKTIQDTIRFAKKLNTEVAAFFIASPLPGTPLYQQARENGYLRPDAKWLDYSPLSNTDPVLSLPGLSSKALRKWHRKALKSYYLRPRYIISRLLAVRHWYEIANLIGGLRIFFRVRN